MADKDDKDTKKPATDEVDEEWEDEARESGAAGSDAGSDDASDRNDEDGDDDEDRDDDDGDDDDDDRREVDDEDPTTIYRPERSNAPARAASSDSERPARAERSSEPVSKSSKGNAVERAASRAAQAHDHGLAHVTPVKLLIGVFGALTVLTVVTVAVTSIDLGSQGNFIVAMIIATVKAGLVMAFFMHLVWDKKFNLTVFLSSFLFALLFLSVSLADRNEYQLEIDQFEMNHPLPQPETLAGQTASDGVAPAAAQTSAAPAATAAPATP